MVKDVQNAQKKEENWKLIRVHLKKDIASEGKKW